MTDDRGQMTDEKIGSRSAARDELSRIEVEMNRLRIGLSLALSLENKG